MVDHIAEVEKNLDRCYDHPNLSPWHVREAMRGMLQLIKDQQAEINWLKGRFHYLNTRDETDE